MLLSQDDINDLKNAKYLLESPGLAAKIVNTFGAPIEKGMEYLPERWEKKVTSLSESALKSGLELAIHTLQFKALQTQEYSNIFHKFCVAASGSVGGAFGLSTLALELPITTTLMLRSIADIAQSEGENLEDVESRLACLEVFALGGTQRADDCSETGYYVIRASLSNAIANASRYIVQTSIIDDTAPILLKLIANIASRFGVVVSEKMAATALPIIGAAGGALINTLFMDHFQSMARGHFIVRRLERTYGQKIVQEAYELL
ncbi:MAG: EcsC family protein [Candidatus Magnetomorum sp.]|nr:EcsC family protein [Candidatus Magnetomorum sp.]